MILAAALALLAAAPAYEKAFSGGPVTLTVRVDPTEVTLSDPVRVEQVVEAEAGFEAELPAFVPEAFEGFAVVESRDDPREARDGRTVRRRRILLETERSGERRIPAFTAYFHRAGEARESHVVSEPVLVEVRPIPGPDAIGLRPLRGPYEGPAPEEKGVDWRWVLLAAIAAAAAALAAVRLLRRRRARAAPPVPAHERALAALRRLLAADLLEKGDVEGFFVALSGVLRAYIEDRFGVRAPERTTEEFLEEAARHPALTAHRDRLGAFLALADLVKFARFSPEDPEIERAFDIAKRFIRETVEHGAPEPQRA